MLPFDPILSQPQTIDLDLLDPNASVALANQEVRCIADAASDLRELRWPWADELYARRVQVTMSTLHGDELVPLTNRYYPGYQETILGSEGVIISKRLAVPFRTEDERAVLWNFECQAEGDTLLRLDVAIDWGEPLTQREVDGLLVAQRNPRPVQGIYQQSNAESTRVFGNPHARPDELQLDDEQGRAVMTYFVLVNGIVDVSLLLTVSDVGEQVAWNAFLALRDCEREFQLSNKAWDGLLKTGRVWTPNARVNHAVQAGKVATLHHLVHLRPGMAPADRSVLHAPVLVQSLDVLDVSQSRNLLAHLRRMAERSEGRLPLLFPHHAKEPLVDPGVHVIDTNGAYLEALTQHLAHHPDPDLLGAHYDAVRWCAETLVRSQWQLRSQLTTAQIAQLGRGLVAAEQLALQQLDAVNAARWASDANEIERRTSAPKKGPFRSNLWLEPPGWQTPLNRPWAYDEPWLGIAFAGQIVWQGCRPGWRDTRLTVTPTLPADWPWWALEALPTPAGAVTLVWDGAILHSSAPVSSALPVQVHQGIRTLNTEDTDFDLTFEFVDEGVGGKERSRFHPRFDAVA